VPAERLWGAQPSRSHIELSIGVERFRWGRPIPRGPWHFLKNVRPWPRGIGPASRKKSSDRPCCAGVIDGRWETSSPCRFSRQVPGTADHMNANEVIGQSLPSACGRCHRSRSHTPRTMTVKTTAIIDDTFSTAMHIATVERSRRNLFPAVTVCATC